MKIVRMAAGMVLMALLAAVAAGCGTEKETAVQQLAQELAQQWQTVSCLQGTREECEQAFSTAVLGDLQISLPEAQQYDVISCTDPASEDERVTILVTGSESTLADFVKGMGFAGYNVEYKAGGENEADSIYQWKAETNGETCIITVTAAPGPLEITVERLHL